MQQPENCIIVIFGGSGDLTKRKLIPALYNLSRHDLMPQNFTILALGRKKFIDNAFRESMKEGIINFTTTQSEDTQNIDTFLQLVNYQNLDVSEPKMEGQGGRLYDRSCGDKLG